MRTPPQLSRARSGGFTLIELVIVLIIIGVLAAVAAPRFIDFTDEADEAAVQSQANALTAANSINVAACALEKTECVTIDESSCANATTLVDDFNTNRFDLRDASGAAPEATFSLTGTSPGDVGDTATCYVGLS